MQPHAKNPDSPHVTVVTPLYNKARFIAECIHSVQQQTYPYWEMAIVDNCSDDGSYEIAKRMADEDSRIRIERNEQTIPVIENYNRAFAALSDTAKYCKPLAADDLLLPDCLAEMVRVAEANPSIGMVSAYGVYSDPKMGVYCWGIPYGQELVDGREIGRGYLLGKGPSVFGAATLSLFRANLVRERPDFFNPKNMHADSEIALDLLRNNNFGFCHQILTSMRIEDASLSSFSDRNNTHGLHRLAMLTHYGPYYLSEKELDSALQQALDAHYRYLGCQFPRLRGRAFWQLHSRGFQEIGLRLRRSRIAKHTLLYLLDLALNPKRTLQRAFER